MMMMGRLGVGKYYAFAEYLQTAQCVYVYMHVVESDVYANDKFVSGVCRSMVPTVGPMVKVVYPCEYSIR